MMSPGQVDTLIEALKKGQERIANELVNLTTELFITRKMFEALLTEEQRTKISAYLTTPQQPRPLQATEEDIPFPGEEALRQAQAVINGTAAVGESGLVEPH